MRLTRLTVGLLCAVLTAGAQSDSNNSGGWTPLSIDDGVVRFEAFVGGQAARVRLGSASPSNAISDAFAASLPLSGEMDQNLPLEQQPPLPSLPLFIASRRVDLPLVYRIEDPGTDVHAGRDFFAESIVQIDYPNKRLRILDEDALKLRSLSNVKARRVDAELGTHVQLIVGDVKIWAAVATEYSGALLVPRSLAERHGWLASARAKDAAVADDQGREIRTASITLDALDVGPYRINGVDVVLMESGESPLAGPYEQDTAILGNDVLRYFQLSIDLDRAYVHVQRPE